MCLRKAFFNRKNNQPTPHSLESAYNIYRGQLLDREWTGLFTHNQETFTIKRDGIVIIGTFDFIHEENGVFYLYDLKAPKTIYYKKKSDGVGTLYRKQVQAYLAMIHNNGKFLNVKKARVLLAADDCLYEEVEANDSDILNFLWTRAFQLDECLLQNKFESLPKPNPDNPEENWQCFQKYCEYHRECEEEKT